MDIKKMQNGNTRILISHSELIDALEEKFQNVYENIKEYAFILEIKNQYGNVEIEIGGDNET